MPLITTGLFRLHDDGTDAVNQDGNRERVYTNDDIDEYGRVWTSFLSLMPRGNAELSYGNPIDTMNFGIEYGDRFPKMGLDRTYIGDGYTLCIELRAVHFLRQGAFSGTRLVVCFNTPLSFQQTSTW